MRSMLIPLELATKSRGLKLFTEYDSKIDIVSFFNDYVRTLTNIYSTRQLAGPLGSI